MLQEQPRRLAEDSKLGPMRPDRLAASSRLGGMRADRLAASSRLGRMRADRLAASSRLGRMRADPFPARTLPDERAARRSLLDQVARLEEELSQLFCSTWPRKGIAFGVEGRGGPRLLALGELEELRDELAARVQHARRALSDRTYSEEQHRRLIEEMLLDPGAHKWRRVSNEDIGEAGCKHWHVRPRWSFIGMLMGWWRVVISSGCPLAGGHGTQEPQAWGHLAR